MAVQLIHCGQVRASLILVKFAPCDGLVHSLIISRVLCHSPCDNSTRNARNHHSVFENYTFNIKVLYPRGQWLNIYVYNICYEAHGRIERNADDLVINKAWMNTTSWYVSIDYNALYVESVINIYTVFDFVSLFIAIKKHTAYAAFLLLTFRLLTTF